MVMSIAAFLRHPEPRAVRRVCAFVLGSGMLLLAIAYALLERNLSMQMESALRAAQHVEQERLAQEILQIATRYVKSEADEDRRLLLARSAALEASVLDTAAALDSLSVARRERRPAADVDPRFEPAENFLDRVRRLSVTADRDELIVLGNVAQPALIEALHRAALSFLAESQRQIRALTTAKYFVLIALFVLALSEALLVVRPLTRALDRAAERLRQLAEEDGLTNLLTRGAFLERATEAVIDSKQRRESVAILLFDVDRLRAIKHCFGAGGGNAAILHAAEIVRAAAPQGALAARWDGDEIILLLPKGSMLGALNAGEEIRRRIEDTVCMVDRRQPIHVTASLGLALLDPDRESLTEAIIRADAHLRRAKLGGRNRTMFGLEDAAAEIVA
jgi:diguanylate cyclase (GGDEF)-like protein